MSATQCTYCGGVHPEAAAFCPNTGRPLRVEPAQPPQYRPPQPPGYAAAPPAGTHAQGGGAAMVMQPISGQGKSVGAILRESFQLYQRHLGVLLVTCAIMIVPVSLAKSAAIAVLLAPTAAVEVAAKNTADLTRRTAEQFELQLQQAQRDPKRWAQTSREQQKQLEDLSRAWATTGTVAAGGLMAWLLGLLATLLGVLALYCIAIPLVTGALTIVVADRATGGQAGPGQAYLLLLRRLGKFLSAWIPAFLLIVLGLCLLIIPGLILGFVFLFVAPVVLIENVGSTAALKRSVELVKASVGQVALVCFVFAAIRIITTFAAHMLIPSTELFLDSFVQDVLLMFLLPVPIIGTVLLYLDIRRQADGLDTQGIRAGIEALRRA